MDTRDEEAQRLFFVSELGAAREISDIGKARHKAEQALEYAAARGIIDRIPKSVLPMVAEMIIDEDGYEPDPLLGEAEREGWSPLHLAVDRDRIDVARALLGTGDQGVRVAVGRMQWKNASKAAPCHLTRYQESSGATE